MKKIPYAIIIMDGYGLAPASDGNAICINGSKYVNALIGKYPSSTLGASGMSVGLPDGQMGNSEVGHLNMGAGRIVYQDLTKITKSIEDGDFYKNSALVKAMDGAKKNGKKLHLWGLLSDGGVHSHITHLFALLEMAKKRGVPQTYVHGFMDGRDVSPTSGAGFVKELQAKMKERGYGKIASLSGRYYSMDRDNNWDRVEKSYDMLTLGNGVQAEDAVKALEESYANGVTDEFVLPHQYYRERQTRCARGTGRQRDFLQFPPRQSARDHPRFHRERIHRSQGHALRAQDGLPCSRLRLLHRIRRGLQKR